MLYEAETSSLRACIHVFGSRIHPQKCVASAKSNLSNLGITPAISRKMSNAFAFWKCGLLREGDGRSRSCYFFLRIVFVPVNIVLSLT